jgi:hypothetical protein
MELKGSLSCVFLYMCVCVYSWYEETTKIPIDETKLMENFIENLIIRLGVNDGKDEDSYDGEYNSDSYTEDVKLLIAKFFSL